MHPRRIARFNELIAQTVSKLILGLKDPEVGFVTVTGAEVSADVSLAKIYYSVYGSPEDQQKTKAALERAKSYIKRELGRLENLRKVPQILFIYDESVERADRVNQILHTIEQENKND